MPVDGKAVIVQKRVNERVEGRRAHYYPFPYVHRPLGPPTCFQNSRVRFSWPLDQLQTVRCLVRLPRENDTSQQMHTLNKQQYRIEWSKPKKNGNKQ